MTEIFTIRNVLDKAKKFLAPVSDSASLEAQLLLAHVLGVERAYLFAHPEQPIRPEARHQFAALVERVASGEPLAYLLGRRAFFDRDIVVTPAVLIPRPETEMLVEAALAFTPTGREVTIVDVGTGSGALAVIVTAHRPLARVYAVDISPQALAVARENAEANRVNIEFLQGDLLQPLIDREIKVDLLMANLPYIATPDLPELAVTRFEPTLALDGGMDGLDLVRRLLEQAPSVCNPGALILLEIGSEQGAAALELARVAFPGAEAKVLPDYAGHDRMVRLDLPGK